MLGVGPRMTVPDSPPPPQGVGVTLLDPLLHLPYAYIWLPGLVFLAIVGSVYWFTRTTQQLVPAEAAAPPPSATIALPAKPKDQRVANRRQGNTVEVHVAPPDQKD